MASEPYTGKRTYSMKLRTSQEVSVFGVEEQQLRRRRRRQKRLDRR